MQSISRRGFMSGAGLATVAAGAAVLGIGASGCASSDAAGKGQKYTPGTYRAQAPGMAGYVSLTTTFSENAITDIQIVDENQTVGICEEVYEQLPAAIIENQSLDVDVVSGATMTSFAVKNAVANCVTQAGGSAKALERVKVAVDKVDESFSYDVVVVGAGLAGLCTAIRAAQEGVRVCIVEKQGVMGSAVFSSGITYIARNDEEVDSMYERWVKNAVTTCEYPNLDRVRALCESSPATMEFLAGMGFEYTAGLNGNLMPVASMGMLRNNIPIRIGSGDPLAKGGEALMRSLQEACETNGVDVFMNTGVTDFVMDGQRVAGVVCDTKRGVKTFNARVVALCSGDYSRSREMMEKYCAESINDVTSTAMGNTGTCMTLAIERAGAAVYDSQQPMSGSLVFEPDNKPLCGQPFDQFPFDCLLVDYNGRRKVREDAPNNHVQHQYFRDPDRPCAGWAIMNRAAARKVWAMDELLRKTGTDGCRIKAYKADTIEELAEKIGVDPKVLADELAKYNEVCKAGVDEEFGKEAKYLQPMEQGPYWAALSYSIIRAIAGGVKTNGDFQVLRADGSAVPGLYAVGISSSREYWGDYYPGAMAIALCTHGGYIAGGNIAKEVRA